MFVNKVTYVAGVAGALKMLVLIVSLFVHNSIEFQHVLRFLRIFSFHVLLISFVSIRCRTSCNQQTHEHIEERRVNFDPSYVIQD